MAKVLPSPTPTATNPFGRAPRRRKPGGRAALRAGGDWLRGLVSAWLHAPNWGRVALVVLTTVILSSLLSLHLLPDKVALRAGDVSPQDVRAPHTIQYVDWAETRALRDVAAAQVDPVYSPERYASRDAEQAITETYARLAREQMLANHNFRRVANELRQEIGVPISSPDALAPLLNDNGAHLAQARRLTSLAVHEAMEREIRNDRPEDMRQARATVTARIADGLLPRALVPGVLAIAQAVLRPNRHSEPGQTQRAREAAMRAVPPQHSELLA
ncbi:MAG: hypothetical protein M3Y13_03065, partial [Armatimonadota bacterium]|nr:hypothetical protein [Armatimonadota bacterium]